MVKLVSIFNLKSGIDPGEAYRVWREKHTSWAKDKMLPEAKKGAINRLIHKYPPAGGRVADFDIFGYEMFWFTDLASALKAAGRWRGAPPDEFSQKFVKTCRMVIVEEENVKL